MINGVTPQVASLQTPLQNMTGRNALPAQAAVAGPSSLSMPVWPTPSTTKSPKAAKSTPGTGLPAPSLDDVHNSFVEFRAKNEDKVSYIST